MKLDLENLVENKVLSFENSSTPYYQLNPPFELHFILDVIQALKQTYDPERENGGLFWFRPVDSVLRVEKLSFIRNKSLTKTGYDPDAYDWNKEFNLIIEQGFLPIAFHTHPTKIGYALYDSKRKNFYLKSSKPDREVAKTIYNQLLMPECIFVEDDNFAGGYGLAIYEGGILPPSFAGFSQKQILFASIAVIGFMLKGKAGKVLLGTGIVLTLMEEKKRPKYFVEPDGSLRITVGK